MCFINSSLKDVNVNDFYSFDRNVFVDAYVDYVLNKSVERVFNEFKKGFYKVCDRHMVDIFHPEELRGVMLGSEEYDWVTFRQVNTPAFYLLPKRTKRHFDILMICVKFTT